MTDWPVWPIFLIELVAFVLAFARKKATFCGVPVKALVLSLLFVCCLLIVVSLFHDSTDTLHLYF